MAVWFKQGVFGELRPEAAEGLRRTERLYAARGEQVYITSIREGTHSPGSFHPQGAAFDMRPGSVLAKDHKAALGPDFDVVDEPTHRHVEYDPKLPSAPSRML